MLKNITSQFCGKVAWMHVYNKNSATTCLEKPLI